MSCVSCQKCISCQIYGSNSQPINQQMGNPQNKQTCGTCNTQKPNSEKRFQEITLWNTSQCNQRCRYCFVYELHKNQVPDSVSDEVINALPAFIDKYMTEQPRIWFFGGEPLFNFKGIKDIYAKVGNKVQFGLTSNMTLMTEDTAQWLGEHGFQVLASLDGIKEAHNKYRVFEAGKGTYDAAIQGLSNARLYLKRAPQIRMTVAPDNTQYVYEGVKMFAKLGYESVAVEPVYETEWNKEDLKTYSEQLSLCAKMITHMQHPLEIKPIMDMRNLFNPQNWKNRCGLAQGGLGMDTDGTFYACHRFVSSHDKENLGIGNVFNGVDFKKIANLNANYKHPVSEDGEERCKECAYRNACIGSCLACNLDVTGTLNTVPRTYCDIVNMYMETFIPKYLPLILPKPNQNMNQRM